VPPELACPAVNQVCGHVFCLSRPLPLLILLTACGSDSSQLPPPLPRPPLVKPAAVAAAPPVAGFTPLPSPGAVLASLPKGRPDPFAAPPAPAKPLAAGGAAAPKPSAPPALRLTGVVLTHGIAQAFVDYGHQSGPVVVGEKGGGAIAWLPEGWRVAAIDVQQGQLLLQAEDGRRVPYQL